MMRVFNILHDDQMPQRDDESGFGCLETERGCLPLIAMNVAATISGLLARTTVRQTFRNSLEIPLEATYIFPLPDRAAVTSFRMRIGDRVIEGQLKERGQARKAYRKAIEDGHRAALAEEDRSGTFSIQVGNIPPKEDVAVELALVGPLPVAAGEATFRFPLVVAPRYTSGIPLDGPSVGLGQASDTEEVPDASRVTPPVLLPGFPNPVALSVEVEVDPIGLQITGDAGPQFSVSLHAVLVEEGPPWKLRLQPGERLNRDFILRIPVAADAVQTSLITSSKDGENHGTFALTLVPPIIEGGTRAPRDVVIVLDRSGSMNGWKMVAARRAAGRIVDSLLNEDSFSVIAFDNEVERPPHEKDKLSPATDRNRWQTIEWLGKVESRGGTEMAGAMAEAIRLLSSADEKREPILILVTDGQVAGEDTILRVVKEEVPESRTPRIHTIGIDRAVNAGFLQRLADAGGGTCDLVESEERLDAAMSHIHRSISVAALTDLKIEALQGSIDQDSVAPGQLPDLFAERPVVITGQCRASGLPLRLRVLGTDPVGEPWQTEITAIDGASDIIRSLWGRARVRDLEDRYAMGVKKPKALAKEIVEVSLATKVLSRFTAYVAVDKSEVVNRGGKQQQVVQPVEIPDGWDVVRTAAAPCSFAVSSDDGDELSSPLFGGLGLRKRASKTQAPAGSVSQGSEGDVDAYERILQDLHKLCKPLKGGLVEAIRNRRIRLLRLLETLRKLVRMLERESLERRQGIESLTKELEHCIQEYDKGGSDALDIDSLNELFLKVRHALSALREAARETREEFWT